MKDKILSEILKTRKVSRLFLGLQYWIAIVSYLVVCSLSILCLAVYLPHLSQADALTSSTLNFFRAMLIIVLISATGFLWWEIRQWRRGRAKKMEQSSLEDVIKSFKKDSNNNP